MARTGVCHPSVNDQTSFLETDKQHYAKFCGNGPQGYLLGIYRVLLTGKCSRLF